MRLRGQARIIYCSKVEIAVFYLLRARVFVFVRLVDQDGFGKIKLAMANVNDW